MIVYEGLIMFAENNVIGYDIELAKKILRILTFF